MKTYNSRDLQDYMNDDWILELLLSKHKRGDFGIRYDEWLYQIEAKRLVYSEVYGDILKANGPVKRVVDVGGGYSTLTELLARNSEYTLVDFLAHDVERQIDLSDKTNRITWVNQDWYDFDLCEDYDIVIANDIFPDVDQRMELFLDKFLPRCKEIRLVLTYYNTPRFYLTRRIDDPEIMTFLSWDGEIVALKLMKYLERVVDTTRDQIDALKLEKDSIYRNGRQVSYIVLKGDL